MSAFLFGCLLKFLVVSGLSMLALAACLPSAKEMPVKPIEIMWGPFDGGYWNLEGVPCEGDEAKFVDQDTGRIYLYVAHRNREGRWLWIYVNEITERKPTPFCCEMPVE